VDGSFFICNIRCVILELLISFELLVRYIWRLLTVLYVASPCVPVESCLCCFVVRPS
jgi:hypothetical protein